MRVRLITIPTAKLRTASWRLESRIIDGCASGREIDLYVAIGSELGRRIALRDTLPESLDAVLDPRD